jgi:hypothetical protein
MPIRRASAAIACLLALLPIAGVAGCGEEEGEPAREGLALTLEGITYNVFITRQVNLQDVEDRGYTEGVPEAPPESTYYGVFLEACNVSEEPLRSASTFRIVDGQENEFEPLDLDPGNPFAYAPTTLPPGECIPAEGSVASSSPTAGVLLMFELPLEAVENQPLELEILDGFDVTEGKPNELVIELDI